MNKLFRMDVAWQRHVQRQWAGRVLSNRGAQERAFDDLTLAEHHRKKRFEIEVKEMEATDILEKALIRAKANKDYGVITAAQYHQIVDKVDSLRKLRFVEDYEKWKDPDTYEWMKFKVAAEVGGDEEREAFHLYEKMQIDEKGELNYRLWR